MNPFKALLGSPTPWFSLGLCGSYAAVYCSRSLFGVLTAIPWILAFSAITFVSLRHHRTELKQSIYVSALALCIAVLFLPLILAVFDIKAMVLMAMCIFFAMQAATEFQESPDLLSLEFFSRALTWLWPIFFIYHIIAGRVLPQPKVPSLALLWRLCFPSLIVSIIGALLAWYLYRRPSHVILVYSDDLKEFERNRTDLNE